MNEKFEKLKYFLDEHGADFLFVSSSNCFLEEFNAQEQNSRFLLTGFKGSSGDALFSKQKTFLFVDPRYHEMASNQVDEEKVFVVKLQMGENFLSYMKKHISSDAKILIVSSKISQKMFETLQKSFKNAKLIDFDPVIDIFSNGKKFEQHSNLEKVGKNISGLSDGEKIRKLQKKLKKNESILILDLADIAYFTNLRCFDERSKSTFASKLFVSKQKAVLFVNCQKNFKLDSDIIEMVSLNRFLQFFDELKNQKPDETIFINRRSINAFDFAKISASFKIKEDGFSNLYKTVKTKEEIDHMKDCFFKTDLVLKKISEKIENFNGSEFDLQLEIEKQFKKHGAKGLSFEPIVAFSKNTSIIHYSFPSKKTFLQEGDLVLIDTGAFFEGGLATDITCTFVKGKASEKQKILYTTVLKGFLHALNEIKCNFSGKKLDNAARSNMKSQFLEGFVFSHALGHGVGINVHEAPPFISSGNFGKNKLKENMVFTIEPGLYKEKDSGVRLERTCYIRKKGKKLKIEPMSKLGFDKKLIDFRMLNKKEKKWLKKWLKS